MLHTGIEIAGLAPVITAGTPIILAAFSGLAFLFRWWLNRYEKRQTEQLEQMQTSQSAQMEVIRHQVQNSHSTNLRDDLDEKFDQVLTTVTEARDHAAEAAREAARANNRLDRQGAEIGGLKRRLDRHIDG